MSRRGRWAIGIAVGALTFLLGFAVFRSGSSQVCDYVVTDPARMAAYGISYPTELCDQGGPHDGVLVDGILTGYHSDTSWRREGGSDAGALISIFAATVLWWLVPVVLGGAQERRHPRPSLEGVKAYREKDAEGGWELQKDGYSWLHDARDNTWTRGDKLPLTGDTRGATWALNRDALLREQNRLLAEQNRLLAGLPPTPPEGPVVRAGDPWQPEPEPKPEAPPRSQ